MAIGERIRFFRTKRGLTQKELGQMMGYTFDTADVRIAQYETESRRPKCETIEELGEILEVSSKALAVPDIDSHVGLLHTLFALEDRYGIHAINEQGKTFLAVDASVNDDAAKLQRALSEWGSQFNRYITGQIPKTEYDQWRYNYSENTKFSRAKPVKVKRVVLRGR